MNPERVEIRGPAILVIFGLGPSDDPPIPLLRFACTSEEELRHVIDWSGRTPKVAEALREIAERWPDFIPTLTDEC